MNLALIEVLDRDGRARLAVPVRQWPVTVGRSIDCDVVLDDPHTAAVHATLEPGDDGRLLVRAGPSASGVRMVGAQLASGQAAALPAPRASEPGTVIELGLTRLRIRLAGQPLLPEEPLEGDRSVSGRVIASLGLAMLAWLYAVRWVEADPGEPIVSYLELLFGVPAALATWCALWALGSKLFRHRFDYWPHAKVALSWLLVMFVADAALHALAYVFSWSWASRISNEVQGLLAAAWLYSHLALVVPKRRRSLAVGVAMLYLAGTAVDMAMTYQRDDRLFDELYMATLGPPRLRLAPVSSAREFFSDAQALKGRLDARVKSDGADDAVDDDTQDDADQ